LSTRFLGIIRSVTSESGIQKLFVIEKRLSLVLFVFSSNLKQQDRWCSLHGIFVDPCQRRSMYESFRRMAAEFIGNISLDPTLGTGPAVFPGEWALLRL
jgi:hypothetical protein